MAQYKVADDPDEVIQCPYDNTHMIRHSRFQYHMMKCRKNHPDIDLRQCPFNAKHWVPKPDHRHHMSVCPDRVLIEEDLISAQKVNSGAYFHGDCTVPEYKNETFKDPNAEDWDSECDKDRRAFVWNRDNANDYFSEHSKQPVAGKPLRLPHGAPHVLRTQPDPYGSASYDDDHSSSRTNGFSQRLPSSLPMAHQAATSKGMAVGRGRGYGTPQQTEPQVGGSMAALQQSPQPSGVNRQMDIGPARPGVGRGYGTPTAVAQSNGLTAQNNKSNNSFNGFPITTNDSTDDDAQSCSSFSSERSGAAAKRSRQPRTINAPTLGVTQYAQPNPIRAQAATSQPPQTIPAQPAPVFGLQGIGRGRGVGRGKASGPAQPPFIVPNVNASTSSDSSDGNNNVGDTKKQIRKNEKKLREIEAVEAKKNRGAVLNDDEIAKIGTKKEIVAQLEQLRITLT